MNVSLKRDGLTLRGDLLRAGGEQSDIAVIFHGLMSSRGNNPEHMFCKIADALLEKEISVVKFDFNGHGESDGCFSDMNIYNEILDAAKIIDYVRSLDFVKNIYIVGHSQGALVGGMIAGLYKEYIKKLIMLAPAATIKDDALAGSCFGIKYDAQNTPEQITMRNEEKQEFSLGGLYFRLARTLPIYETTSMFEGDTLIIHGSEDEAVGIIGSKRYTECMKNASLEIIDGENHGLCAFSLDKTICKIADFLAG